MGRSSVVEFCRKERDQGTYSPDAPHATPSNRRPRKGVRDGEKSTTSPRKNLRGLRLRRNQRSPLPLVRCRSIKGKNGAGCLGGPYEAENRETKGSNLHTYQRTRRSEHVVGPQKSAELA